MWDWQYFVKYSSHSYWIGRIFCKILLVPQNIVMDMNNVMLWSMVWHKVKFCKEGGLLWSIIYIMVAFNEWQGLVIGSLIWDAMWWSWWFAIFEMHLLVQHAWRYDTNTFWQMFSMPNNCNPRRSFHLEQHLFEINFNKDLRKVRHHVVTITLECHPLINLETLERACD